MENGNSFGIRFLEMRYLFRFCTFLLLLVVLRIPIPAQTVLQFSGGMSYIEHFSTGINLELKRKHTISLLYGSNFFVNTGNNSSFMMQYQREIHSLDFFNFIPVIGIKGGYVIYSDDFYRWNLVTIIPQLGLRYPIKEKLNFELNAGLSYSRVLEINRLHFGNIGWYKEFLPEFKFSLLYSILKK